MQLYSIRGGTKEDLEAKKYTIGVGISLGNKWFTVDNIIQSIEWALAHTKDKVIVYVADSIHAINIEVRNRIRFEKALDLCKKSGQQLFHDIKVELDKKFSQDQIKQIVFVTWDEIVDAAFQKKVNYLNSLYEENILFKEKVHSIVRNHVSKETRIFSEDDIHRFGQYITAEMPEFLNRVPLKNIVCDAYVYPYDNDITQFAEQIQWGKVFPEIKEHVLDTEPKVFLEVR